MVAYWIFLMWMVRLSVPKWVKLCLRVSCWDQSFVGSNFYPSLTNDLYVKCFGMFEWAWISDLFHCILFCSEVEFVIKKKSVQDKYHKLASIIMVYYRKGTNTLFLLKLALKPYMYYFNIAFLKSRFGIKNVLS